MHARSEQVAWAAGLLEGEGSFLLKRKATPVVMAQMTDLDVLEAIQYIFNGNIWTATTTQAHHKPSWRWQTTGGFHGATVMRAVRPFMLARRGARIDECLATWDRVVDAAARQRMQRLERDREILRRYNSGETITSIATSVGLSRNTVQVFVKPPGGSGSRGATVRVARVLLADPAAVICASNIVQHSGVGSTMAYPMLSRMVVDGWLEDVATDPESAFQRRRDLRLTAVGVERLTALVAESRLRLHLGVA